MRQVFWFFFIFKGFFLHVGFCMHVVCEDNISNQSFILQQVISLLQDSKEDLRSFRLINKNFKEALDLSRRIWCFSPPVENIKEVILKSLPEALESVANKSILHCSSVILQAHHMRERRSGSTKSGERKSLEEGYVSYFLFASEILKKFSNFKTLKVNFHNLNISSENLKYFFKSFESLINIESLDLSLHDAAFDADSFICFYEMLMHFKNLKKLTLSFQITDNFFPLVKSFAASMENLENLELCFRYSAAVEDKISFYMIEILQALKKIHTLKLTLSSCDICSFVREQVFSKISQALKDLVCLKVLTLDFKNSHRDLVAYAHEVRLVLQALEQLSHLEVLRLDFTLFGNMNDVMAADIAQRLSSFKKLHTLSFNVPFHEISNDGLIKIVEAIALLEHLRFLTLDFTSNDTIDENGLKGFIKRVIKIQTLRHLKLVFLCTKVSTFYDSQAADALEKEIREPLGNLICLDLQIKDILAHKVFCACMD